MTIPATHCEIEQIYLAAELANCRSLCVTSCQSGDGVTSIATALAERCLLAGHKTLLIDLNLFKPTLNPLPTINTEHEIGLVEYKQSQRLFTGISVPQDPTTQLAYKDPATMSRAVVKWATKFDRIIIDTSPLLNRNRNNISAQSVANACDKVLLVVKGGATTNTQVTQALQLLQSDNIALLGSILNLQDQPTLSQELVRQLKRTRFLPQRLMNHLENKLLSNRFLSQSA